MGLFICFVVFALSSWGAWFFGKYIAKQMKDNPYGDVNVKDVYYIVGVCLTGFVALVACVTLLFSIVGTCKTYANADIDKIKYEERYKVLIYELENNVYDQDGNFVETNSDTRYKLINDVRIWNEDVATMQKKCVSLWYGIEYPNFYLNLKLIDLNDYILNSNNWWNYNGTDKEGLPNNKPVAVLL